ESPAAVGATVFATSGNLGRERGLDGLTVEAGFLSHQLAPRICGFRGRTVELSCGGSPAERACPGCWRLELVADRPAEPPPAQAANGGHEQLPDTERWSGRQTAHGRLHVLGPDRGHGNRNDD